jgi:manganese transport protein
MIALVAFTRRRDIMGGFVNSPDAGCGRDRHGRDPIALNGVLVLQTFGAPIAGLPAS